MCAAIPGLILVRASSTRLPKKCFLPLGECSVIEHVGKRAIHFGFDPVICTTEEEPDNAIYELAVKNKWKVFRGSTKDKIRRLRDACDAFNISEFITIDADDPLFDPEVDQRIFPTLRKGFHFVVPPDNYYCGSAGYAVKKQILDRAINEADTSDSEMMWKIIEKVKELKFLNFLDPMIACP